MSLIDNYKNNSAIQAVTGDLAKAKRIIGGLESSRLTLDDSTANAEKLLDTVTAYFTQYGNVVNKWPPYAINDFSDYIQLRYSYYSASINYIYLQKLVDKMVKLSQSVLNGLPKSEAKQRFNDYDNYLKSLLAYDILTMLYLESLATQQDPDNTSGKLTVDTNKAMNRALKAFKTRKYKLVNRYDVDTQKIIRDFPVRTEQEWFNYVEHPVPAISEHKAPETVDELLDMYR